MSQQQTPTPQGIVPTWTIADRLRKAREHAGLNQLQFAAETGISRQTISNYELGNTKPNRVFVAAWALRTGVPVDWLTDGIEPTGGPNDPSGQGFTPSGWIEDEDVLADVVELRPSVEQAA